jgi:hypothetical protein
MSKDDEEFELRVLERAYFLWVESGRLQGQAEEFWRRARQIEEAADRTKRQIQDPRPMRNNRRGLRVRRGGRSLRPRAAGGLLCRLRAVAGTGGPDFCQSGKEGLLLHGLLAALPGRRRGEAK